jgi:hypothetical protein
VPHKQKTEIKENQKVTGNLSHPTQQKPLCLTSNSSEKEKWVLETQPTNCKRQVPIPVIKDLLDELSDLERQIIKNR